MQADDISWWPVNGRYNDIRLKVEGHIKYDKSILLYTMTGLLPSLWVAKCQPHEMTLLQLETLRDKHGTWMPISMGV